MLKPAASSNEGHVVFSGVLNAPQRALQALVRTAGTAKQRAQFSEVVSFIGRQPNHLDFAACDFSRLRNAAVGGNVGWVSFIEVANDPDSRLSRHL